MISRLFLVGLALSCLWLAPPAAAEDALPHPRRPDLGPSERVDALIERVRIEQAKLESLQADFVQLKQSAMLVEPLESRGGFTYAAPNRVRWEYESPDPISILIDNEEMVTWYRDIQQAELVSIGQQTQKVLEYLGASSSLDDLLEYFLVTLTVPIELADPYVFDLSPKFDKVAKRIQGMTIWIHPDHFLPTRLRYVEADGDITDLRFERIDINVEVPADAFELELPEDVEIRRVALDSSAAMP